MLNSIQHFIENGVPNLQKASKDFSENPLDFAGFVSKVRNEALQMALDYISETLTTCNQILKDSPIRREKWEVVRTDEKTLITSIGKVVFSKTLFKNKETGERRYLLDDMLEFDPHERMSEDAIAQLLSETVQTSYRKGGKAASILDEVSKETVKDKIHALEFPKEQKRRGRKRKVEYLYIEADEDHVSLQFQKKKGDLQVNQYGRKLNGMINKLIYVHEGIEKDAPKSTRHHLVNAHYFCGAYEGKANSDLWDEVYTYIDNNYDISSIKRIYLGADGGAWIKAGGKRISGITYILDEFHLKKYLIKMTNHMKDSAYDARKVLSETIRDGSKEDFLSVVDMLEYHAESAKEKKYIQEGASYILENWSAAKIRLRYRRIPGCSTEGHVSHVLAKRMSMTPMGWSRKGADRMAKLSAYAWNKKDMLELVRYQKTILPKAVGAEEVTTVVAEVRNTMHKQPVWGKYYDSMQVELSGEMKKWMSIGMHNYIWKLF